MNNFPMYTKTKAEDFIDNQDFPVVQIENILSDEHIAEIYYKVAQTDDSQTITQPWAGHKAYHTKFSNDVISQIEKRVSEIVGEEMIMAEYSFARYSEEYGYKCKLFPHYDTKKSQRVTCDIQLESNEDWGIIVEGEQYNLNYNDALIFAGSQQMHWREDKRIGQDTKIDMMFCHLVYKNDRPLQENHVAILEKRTRALMMDTGIDSQIETNDRKE